MSYKKEREFLKQFPITNENLRQLKILETVQFLLNRYRIELQKQKRNNHAKS